MFTDKTQRIIDIAKDRAYSKASSQLDVQDLADVICMDAEGRVLLAECLTIEAASLHTIPDAVPAMSKCPRLLDLTKSMQVLLGLAKELAEEKPIVSRPGLIDLRHIVCAVAMSPDVCARLGGTAISRNEAIRLLSAWHQKDIRSPSLEDLTARLRELRTELFTRVFGQDHAIQAFVEGLFNAEVLATADDKRKAPRAVFVFAGPPGVGKTYMAELGASYIGRPLKRFDMSGYSGLQQNEALVGISRSYHGAHPGVLTDFVSKNPDAVLLFDEIEKAHYNTIHLFLQVLDSGTLEDKYHEKDISFRDTTIIFTTNAGRKLYDRPNMSGVHRANAAFHRNTVLDALENDVDPQTRQPFFPQAICSRLATGYPVLFNYLGVNELERVVSAEFFRQAGLFEKQYYKQVTSDELVGLCLVLREGAKADARALRSQTETFVKSEIFKLCQLFKTDRIEEALKQTKSISFSFEKRRSDMSPDIRSLFTPEDKPRVLLVADKDLTDLYRKNITGIDWVTTSIPEESLQILADKEIDLVLIDLWVGKLEEASSQTIKHFDHVPSGASGLAKGQELLHKIRERLPELSVYLLSLHELTGAKENEASIDEELFMACVRGGGARGIIESNFVGTSIGEWEKNRDRFTEKVIGICQHLYRERMATRLAQEHKVLTFDTAPRVEDDGSGILIRLRDLRLTRAVAAADAAEVLDEVERPQVRFIDVVGADSAKEELKFFIDYLKNPKRFAALGLKPPKGVLLHGPPGTGKTMLARAMAGESNLAFIPVTASSFVTIWQGSGPQNVRDLFERARRYAPSIVFIDEIDAIGRTRTGSAGGSQATENTLNALLTEMDGFTSPSVNRPVFILAATNFKIAFESQDSPEMSPRTLDPALVRRFARTILVDLPDTNARKKYLILRLSPGERTRVSESTINLLAEKSIGMSIADVEAIIETAARTAVRKDIEMTDEILIEALDTAREGEAKEWSPEFLESTARHEAGHTVMYWLSGWISPEVSIIARAEHGGGMRRCEEEIKRECLTRDEMLARIRTSLGGRAAELLYFGNSKGLTTGAAGDLEDATNIARQMVCRYGMDAEFGLITTPELFKLAQAVGSPTYERVNDAARKMLREEMDATLKLLEKNRKQLDNVTNALLGKNRILRSELTRILSAID